MTIFVLDTNVISDIAAPTPKADVLARLTANRKDILCLTEVVDYEIRRGYLRKGATSQLYAYEQIIKPQYQWVRLTADDWKQAAQFWANTVKQGRVLSDIDLLLAAIAKRLDAVIVSADADFDGLPVRRENWRTL